MLDIEKIVRKLAKSYKWQTIYNNAKEVGLKLFNNDKDLTRIQIMFLSYLNFYSAITMDIVLNEVSDRVLDNFIYEDAYMYYKQKRKKRDVLKTDALNKRDNTQIKWVFKKPSKR